MFRTCLALSLWHQHKHLPTTSSIRNLDEAKQLFISALELEYGASADVWNTFALFFYDIAKRINPKQLDYVTEMMEHVANKFETNMDLWNNLAVFHLLSDQVCS